MARRSGFCATFKLSAFKLCDLSCTVFEFGCFHCTFRHMHLSLFYTSLTNWSICIHYKNGLVDCAPNLSAVKRAQSHESVAEMINRAISHPKVHKVTLVCHIVLSRE